MAKKSVKQKKASIDDLYAEGPNQVKTSETDEDVAAVINLARERATDGSTYWKDNWDNAEADLKFLGGDQWPSKIMNERDEDGRPCLVNNVLPTFTDRVLGEQRKNKTQIKINATQSYLVPKKTVVAQDPEGNPLPQDPNTEQEFETLKIPNMTGKKQYELAEVLQGIIKNIEYNCDAEDAYDLAYQASVQSGFGYLRVRTDYMNEEFEQDVIIECLENQFSVTMDPMWKKPDTSDKNWTLIDELMEKSTFENEYPDAVAQPLATGNDNSLNNWFTEKTVRVSEYYTRVPKVKTKCLLTDGRAMWKEDLEPILDELLEKGVYIQRERQVKTYEVFWRKITGLEVLEGPIKLDCTIIPVVPIFGKKLRIKEKTTYISLIRHSKDAMRMSNYWDSAATETVALAPKAPFVGTAEQIEGYEKQWENANSKNQGILTYNASAPGDRGPMRSQPAAIPAAELTLGQNATDKIKATLGMFDASLGAQGNETSGKAINARINQADAGSYTFSDNFYKGLRMVGRICVELIPKTYDTERVMRIKFQDETEDFVKINEQILDEETQEYVTVYDLGLGKYDVTVSSGPAYATQRMEAADTMLAFIKAAPETGPIIMDLVAQNMDWEGSDVVAERLKKIVDPKILSAAEREQMQEDQPAPPPPTPQEQAVMELEGKKVAAEGLQAEADIKKAEADIAQANLESAEAQSQLAVLDKMAKGGDEMAQFIREIVTEAMAQITTQ